MASERKWKSTRTPPEISGAVLVRREIGGIELAEFWPSEGQYFEYGESRDREDGGLSPYTDVTHWAEVEPPPFDYQEQQEAALCNRCGGPFGVAREPPGGWELESGEIVCQSCCVDDTAAFGKALSMIQCLGNQGRTDGN